MLEHITFLLPVKDQESSTFFSGLKKIFSEIPGVVQNKHEIVIKAKNPENALPELHIKLSNNDTLAILFDSKSVIDNEINAVINETLYEGTSTGNRSISITEFYDKLNGHILRIDHTGINLPSYSLSHDRWINLIHIIAKITNIYHYPTGEPWPFILPATRKEFQEDIHEFCVGREPKFELVYDKYNKIPTFQFDIETDLMQKEVERLFPTPLGKSYKGLETYFRAVTVRSPYPVIFRFDVRFKNENPADDWSTGKWLVEEGKRIGPFPQ